MSLQKQDRLIPLFASLLILAACSTSPGIVKEERVLYPAPPDPPRIQFLRSLSAGSEIEPGRSALDSLLFGEAPDVAKPIVKPTAMAVHRGIIYVTDSQVGGVYSIDLRGQKIDILRPRGRGALQKPSGIFIAAEGPKADASPAPLAQQGEIYISDAARKQILVYDLDWAFLKELGPWDKNSSPQDVVASADRLYVADTAAHCVRVLDRKTGKQLYLLGEGKDLATGLIGPTHLDLDDEGNLYVVDTIRIKVQVWNKDGEFVRTIGGAGDRPGFFSRPKDIAVSGRTIWVIDAFYAHCQILDLNGRPLMYFAGGGTGPGQLYLPRALWIGKEGLDLFKDYIEEDFVAEKLIIIASQYGPRKLNFYAFGHSRKFEYPDTPLPERPTKTDTKGESK